MLCFGSVHSNIKCTIAKEPECPGTEMCGYEAGMGRAWVAMWCERNCSVEEVRKRRGNDASMKACWLFVREHAGAMTGTMTGAIAHHEDRNYCTPRNKCPVVVPTSFSREICVLPAQSIAF